jgi:hypothetical protein
MRRPGIGSAGRLRAKTIIRFGLYMLPGAELCRLTLMHMHQGQRFFLLLLVSLTRVVHQVRLKNVHQEDVNLSSKGYKLEHASRKIFLELRPY